MRTICQNILIVSLALGGVFTACQEEDTIEQTVVETILPETGEEETTQSSMLEAYNAAWVETLGEIDPNHDWSAAMRVTAKIYLREAAGEHTVRIYTHEPTHPDCRILANTKMTGTGTISFDALKTQEEVFIKITSKNGRTITDKLYPINNKNLEIRTSAIGSRSLGECTTFVCDTFNLGQFGRNVITENGTQWQTDQSDPLYYLSNVKQNAIDPKIKFSVIKNILKGGGVLGEGEDPVTKWEEYLGRDAEIVVKEAGPVSISILCGGTIFYDMVGYFYYNEDDKNDLEKLRNAPKYLLIDDARPKSNIRCYESADTYHIPAGMETPTWANGNQHNSHLMEGQEYHLVYFDPNNDYQATYNFPEGTHIGFFIIKAGNEQDEKKDLINNYFNESFFQGGRKIYYSLPILNDYYGNYKDVQDPSKGASDNAIVFEYNGTTYMGMEDGGDIDINDIFFTLTGNFEEHTDLGEKEEKPQTWIIACEDLGSADDYDFNDIVFSVSHVAGRDYATVTPLAAGGICSSYLYYDYNKQYINGTWPNLYHGAIDPNLNVNPYNDEIKRLRPLNVDADGGGYNPGKGEPMTITVPKDFSITNNMGNFKIEVINQYAEGYNPGNPTIAAFITGNNHNDKSATAPQMICIPEGWKWPKERQLIYDVYPQFKDWNQDQQSNLEWYKTIGEGKENAVFSFE